MVRGYACGLDIIVRLFSVTFSTLWTYSSSYNFIPIFFKLCTCFLHDLKMCMWFGCNPCINFCHFFHFGNFF